METFSALLAICAGNSPVTGGFPTRRPVARSFDVFFDLRLNIQLSKQWWGWWFETPWRPLWRHCNVISAGNNSGNLNNHIIVIVEHTSTSNNSFRAQYDKCVAPRGQSDPDITCLFESQTGVSSLQGTWCVKLKFTQYPCLTLPTYSDVNIIFACVGSAR